MAAIRIYEPALCCTSGVCGTDSDPSLVTVAADVRTLKDLGVDIERHNLASDPLAFTTDEMARDFMHNVGSPGLPLTVVDGVTVATGSYSNRTQLLAFAGLGSTPKADPGPAELGLADLGLADLGLAEKSGGCCGSATGCC
jgi:hypothetical protein